MLHSSHISMFLACLNSALNLFNHHRNAESVIVNSTTATSLTQGLSPWQVKERMKKLGIVPHIIPEPPQTIIDIAYKYYLSSIYLQNNNEDTIPHNKLSKLPTIHWADCDPRKYYTLFMTFINITNQGSDSTNYDPESLAKAKQYHHMLYTNIAHCNLRHADVIFTYEPPPSNENNETRIYLFSLMEQKDGIVHLGFKEKYNHGVFLDLDTHNSYRSNFTIKEFMNHFEAELLAGNYMKVVTVPKPESFLKKYYSYLHLSSFFNTSKTKTN